MVGYYVILEASFGWTIGKLVTGTRVVRFDGDKPHFPQILGRTFARFIPFEPFSVLFGGSATAAGTIRCPARASSAFGADVTVTGYR